MSTPSGMRIVVCGLSITSSWGNGHATTYRALIRELGRRGHETLFLERDVPWYREHRDLPRPPFGQTALYESVADLRERYGQEIREADAVIVGSFVPDGVQVGEFVTREASGVTAFYDIDTPVTLARLARGEHDYLSPELIGRYDVYLSFSGGPTLARLEQEYGARAARALYCSVDPELYSPQSHAARWDLGYMGTYSDDRQPTVERLLCAPARAWTEGRFVVAGPQYPESVSWPPNVERVEHLPPARHREFYTTQRWTLNVTRADMIAAGWSPSVRLFEAAACGTPIISDAWSGLDELFEPGSEIIVASDASDVLRALRDTPESERRLIGERARARVLASHTAAHRAQQLEEHLLAALARTATA